MTRKLVGTVAVIVGGLATAPIAAGGTLVYVDQNAGGPTHDGSSWCGAYLTLSEAMDVATPGDTIRVADGTYTPDPSGLPDPREATFQLVSGVDLEGGYAGCGAPDPDERDFALYETILSGDLEGDDTPTESDCCYAHDEAGCDDPACQEAVCDVYPECCTDPWDESCALYARNLCPGVCVYQDNTYHVVTGSGTDTSALLDGFTITAGNADGAGPHWAGGGMYNEIGSPTLTNCTFSGNSASHGGGMYNSGSPTLTNCTFNWNAASLEGGGMFNNWGAPTLTNCTFSSNSASRDGGGMFNWGSPTLTNCTFSGNSAASSAGGMYNNGTATLTNCTFTGNSGGGGGGMLTYGSPTLTNCTFSGNSAVYGAGMYNSSGTPTLTNCIFSGNSAFYDGGGVYNPSGSPMLTNCILWGNSDSGGTDESAQIHGGTPTVNYSCVQGWLGGLGGTANFGDDPLLIDPDGPDDIPGTEDDDLRLVPCSPCIDAGNNAAVPPDTPDLDEDGDTDEPIPFDLDGNPRIVDGDGDGTETVDMGAYEHQARCHNMDADGDGDIDLSDFAVFQNCMSGPGE